MDFINVQEYFNRAQEISHQIDREPGALQELLHLIECYKNGVQQNTWMEEFFKGEYAFHTGYYERALKHYLEAKGCEKYEFYCYRASAFVARGQNCHDKALGFVKKALEICPEEHFSQKLFSELLSQPETVLKIEEKVIAPIGVDKSAENPVHSIARSTIQKLRIDIGKQGEESISPFLAKSAEEDLFAKAVINKFSLPGVRTSLQGNEGFKAVAQMSKEVNNGDQAFRTLQIKRASEYVCEWKTRSPPIDNSLYVFQGWSDCFTTPQCGSNIALNETNLSLLYEGAHKSSGGFFIRWHGKGIVINPGRDFFLHFHRAGLHVKDIDFVVAVNEETDTYVDIKKIYDLIYHFNQSEGAEWHLVHYYLHSKIYQKLSSTLKPHSKQERHAVHKLELFFDSPEGEKIDLMEGVRLHYFPTPISFNHSDKVTSPFGMRLELKGKERSKSLTLGYVSQANQAPFIHHHLGQCDLLLVGLGENHHLFPPHDNSFISRCNAINAMISEFAPKLVLLTEFDGLEGDNRLEMTMRLREDSLKGVGSTIVPADIGLFVDLETMQIRCASTGEQIDAERIHIVRSAGIFSRLNYFAPICLV